MQKRYKGRYRSATTRLRGYDYASAGWYHVVMCTQDRVCWLGDIRNGIVGLSPVGCRAYRNCAAIPDHFDHAVMDAFIVMPNHVHAIIGLTASAPHHRGSDARSRVATGNEHTSTEAQANAFGPLKPGALPTIVHAYKGSVTRWARRHDAPDFEWQARFYDRIIRNERELIATRQYVLDNPRQWTQDRNYPRQG